MSSETSLLDSYGEAVKAFLQKFPAAEQALCLQQNGLEKLLDELSQLDRVDKTHSTPRRLVEAIKPAIRGLEAFGKAIDVLSNAKPEFLSLLWGVLRIILQLANKYLEYFEKTARMLSHIGDNLHRFYLYSQLYPQSLRLREVLLRVYTLVLEFIWNGYSFFADAKRKRAFVKKVWKTFKTDSGAICQCIRDQFDNVEKEVSAVEREASHNERQAQKDERQRQVERWNEMFLHNKTMIEQTEVVQRQQQLRRREKKYEKVLEWLSGGRLELRRLQDIRNLRQAGTGEWFFETDEWLSWIRGDITIFWLRGKAGTGKTVLTGLARDHLWEEHNEDIRVAVAHVFLAYDDKQNQSADRMTRDLLKQIIEQQRLLHPTVEELFNNKASSELGTVSSLGELLSTLKELILQSFDCVYLFIDALDECDDKMVRQEVIDVVKNLSASLGQSLRIFVTSRPHLTDLNHKLENCSLILDLTAHEADVWQLIKQRLGNEKIDTQFAEEIYDKVSNYADGMILYIVCQLDYILEQPNLRARRQALETMPESLNATYEKMLSSVRNQGKAKEKLCFKVLTWIKYAQRPLKWEELQQAIAVEDGDTSFDNDSVTDRATLVEFCQGLISVHTVSDTVRFSHFTIKEFLHGRLDIFQNAYLPQHLITSTCLTYLTMSLPEAKHSHKDLLVTIDGDIPPFLNYATENWHLHLHHYLAMKDQASYDTQMLHKLETLLASERRMQVLLKADFAKTEHDKFFRFSSAKGTSSIDKLHAAAIWGLDDLVKLYVRRDGVDVNLTDCKKRTALSWACEYGWPRVVQTLLESETIQPDAVDLTNRSPLWWTVRQNRKDVLEMLLNFPEVQRDRPDRDGRTPLIRAAMKGATDCVRVLLGAESVNVNATDAHGRTPFWWACRNNRIETVKVLLQEAGDRIEVDREDNYGQTPLMRACIKGYESVVIVLLSRSGDGVNINAQDVYGRTALIHTVRSSWSGGLYEEIVGLLLSCDGIDPTILGHDGRSAMDWAKIKGITYFQLTKYLGQGISDGSKMDNHRGEIAGKKMDDGEREEIVSMEKS